MSGDRCGDGLCPHPVQTYVGENGGRVFVDDSRFEMVRYCGDRHIIYVREGGTKNRWLELAHGQRDGNTAATKVQSVGLLSAQC